MSIFSASTAFAAFDRLVGDPVLSGMGRSGLAFHRNGGFLANPALKSRPNVAVWWDQPFGLKELSSKNVVVSSPIRNVFAGVSYSQSGNTDFSEQQFTMAGSYPVFSEIRAGLSVSSNRLAISGLPTGQAVAANLGVVGKLSTDVQAGAVWKNVAQARVSNYEDNVPTSIAAGLLFSADDRTDVAFEIEQQPGWPMEVRAGVSSRVMKALILRGGTRFNPAEYTAGFTVSHRIADLHYALMWHRDLGASHALGLDVFLH